MKVLLDAEMAYGRRLMAVQ